MRIEQYFKLVREVIESNPVVRSSEVTYDKRSTHEGFIRGALHLVGGSSFHFREYVDVEGTIERLMYVYQYMDDRGTQVFRYDNAGHHGKLQLSTHPHHKHLGDEDAVIESSAPELGAVLKEVEREILRRHFEDEP